MKWKGSKEPYLNESRLKNRIAYLPVKLTNGGWIWFEYYIIRQTYHYNSYAPGKAWQVDEKYQQGE